MTASGSALRFIALLLMTPSGRATVAGAQASPSPASPSSATRSDARAAAAARRNVVLIVADGLRWQEVFTGADSSLLNDTTGGIWMDADTLRRDYWRPDPADRRALLFPFLWGVVAKRGQLFGDQLVGSVAHVTNGQAFSYPGYNEMLTGHPDPRITSNEFGPNPNVSVFEWLNGLPDFRDRVAVYATWRTFKDIFNEPRSHLVMQVGWDPPYRGQLTPRQALLNELYRTTSRLDDEDVYDAFLQIPLLEFIPARRPRVLFVGYGETDNWGHAGRYDLLLQSAHAFDGFVRQLWHTVQSIPGYRNNTTFVITTDHGRGSGPVDWKEHGVDQRGSENVWIAMIGPDTPPLGERAHIAPVTQAQIAATVAALVGKRYQEAAPDAAPPLPGVIVH